MKNYKIILFVFFTLLMFFDVQNVDAQKEKKLKNSLLWRISGNGLEKPSYLFGTVHVLDSANYFLDETTVEQLQKSARVVFENDLDEPGYQQQTLKLAMMENDSLTHYLTDGEFTKLEDFFKNEFNFPLAAVKTMKPFYVASVIGALSFPKNSKSYEAELLKLAKKYNKEVLGITNPEIENEIISQIPMSIQVNQIWEAVEEYKEGYPLKEKIMNAYKKSDITQIYSLMKEDNEVENVVYEFMFPRRHEIWVPNMIELMEEFSCFFAIGVGHLPGEKGIIELLRKNGFKVKPVNIDFKLHN